MSQRVLNVAHVVLMYMDVAMVEMKSAKTHKFKMLIVHQFQNIGQMWNTFVKMDMFSNRGEHMTYIIGCIHTCTYIYGAASPTPPPLWMGHGPPPPVVVGLWWGSACFWCCWLSLVSSASPPPMVPPPPCGVGNGGVVVVVVVVVVEVVVVVVIW